MAQLSMPAKPPCVELSIREDGSSEFGAARYCCHAIHFLQRRHTSGQAEILLISVAQLPVSIVAPCPQLSAVCQGASVPGPACDLVMV